MRIFAGRLCFFAAGGPGPAVDHWAARRMDALSEALGTVRMTGAIFVNAEVTAPWGFVAPPAQQGLRILAPGSEHLIVYHLLTEGKALAEAEGMDPLPLGPGDIVIVPHGDPHVMSNGAPSTLIDSAAALGEYVAGDLKIMRYGGGGAVTRFICGFLGCERQACRLFLAGLPPMIRINIRGDAGGTWLESSIRHLVSETGARRAGGPALLSKMAEVLFIEALRRYAEHLPAGQTGWLAGARDPVVGAALALLHREPCRSWTVAALAAAVGASRSVLVERFDRFLGEPPLGYLRRWRLQRAARLLQTSRRSILQVASDVGYESEAAFNRAFKREFDLPPAQYRRKIAANGAAAAP